MAFPIQIYVINADGEDTEPIGFVYVNDGISKDDLLKEACQCPGCGAPVERSRMWLRTGTNDAWDELPDSIDEVSDDSPQILIETKTEDGKWPFDEDDSGEIHDEEKPRESDDQPVVNVYGKPRIISEENLALFKRAKRSFTHDKKSWREMLAKEQAEDGPLASAPETQTKDGSAASGVNEQDSDCSKSLSELVEENAVIYEHETDRPPSAGPQISPCVAEGNHDADEQSVHHGESARRKSALQRRANAVSVLQKHAKARLSKISRQMQQRVKAQVSQKREWAKQKAASSPQLGRATHKWKALWENGTKWLHNIDDDNDQDDNDQDDNDQDDNDQDDNDDNDGLSTPKADQSQLSSTRSDLSTQSAQSNAAQ